MLRPLIALAALVVLSHSSVEAKFVAEVSPACEYGTTVSNSGCKPCPTGMFYQPDASYARALATCQPCPAQSHQSDTGALACKPCALGSYAPVEGLTECTACPDSLAGVNGEIFGSCLRRDLSAPLLPEDVETKPSSPVLPALDGDMQEAFQYYLRFYGKSYAIQSDAAAHFQSFNSSVQRLRDEEATAKKKLAHSVVNGNIKRGADAPHLTAESDWTINELTAAPTGAEPTTAPDDECAQYVIPTPWCIQKQLESVGLLP